MSLTRLQELASLHQAAFPAISTQVDEAKKPKDSFHAIQDFINDSISDLEDALGSPDKEGTLYGLEPRPSVYKLAAALAAFKKVVEKTLTEVEVDFMSDEAEDAKKLKEGLITEGKDYEDSGDFTNELHDIGTAILKLKQITRQPRWKNWMRVTDENFSTSTVALEKDFSESLTQLDKSFDALEDELHSAS